MSTSFPVIEVAVVLIVDDAGERFLADYSNSWGGFTFPLTGHRDDETWEQSAFRAAAEVLGRPLRAKPLVLNHEIPPWNQSGRDGEWKRYTYRAFALKASHAAPLHGHIAVWLTPAEFAGHPVTPTARQIVELVTLSDVATAPRV